MQDDGSKSLAHVILEPQYERSRLLFLVCSSFLSNQDFLNVVLSLSVVMFHYMNQKNNSGGISRKDL